MPKVTEAWKKNKPLYKPVHSSNPKKKGMVWVKSATAKSGKKLLHFGDASMTDFKKGASKEQRKSYLARSGGIKNKAGQLTKNDKNSANYWSRKINW